jgi:Nucleotidyl transferase AbiEii toxin, Type IV TA system
VSGSLATRGPSFSKGRCSFPSGLAVLTGPPRTWTCWGPVRPTSGASSTYSVTWRRLGADDGVTFLPDTVAGAAIHEEANYEGIRITLEGRLGAAKLPLQVDVGFGDAVTPAPVEASYPVLLADMPAPRLRVYARETAIAEKVEAMVTLAVRRRWFLATRSSAIRRHRMEGRPGGKRACECRW